MAGRADNVYMGITRKGRRQLMRQYGPYAFTAFFVAVMLWWAQGLRREMGHERRMLPIRPLHDWTQQIRVRPTRHDAPDDDTAALCPTPTGNWPHTCQRDLLIEGPCAGRCLLTAVCKDVSENFINTTFEFTEGEILEAKNVNGLLCTTRDGTLSCGVNFHGNLAMKNCVDGHVPRRHEVHAEGLPAPVAFEGGNPPATGSDCGSPPYTTGLDLSDCSDTRVNGQCSVKCMQGFVGDPWLVCLSTGWKLTGSCKAATRDWTHRLALENTHHREGEPDDRNEESCPTPRGNWRHTCLEDIVVEGPCSGKCLLKARCNGLDKDLHDTTYEYREYEKREIKNVNGLLCYVDKDDTPVCGVNFHGNLALKNCADGRVPHRHEKLDDGLPADSDDRKRRVERDEDDRRHKEDDDENDDFRRRRERDDDEDRDRSEKRFKPVEWGKKRRRRREDEDEAEGRGWRRRRDNEA